MAQAEIALVRYIFLDVVSFTKGRSVEAQSDIVAALNQIVRDSLGDVEIDPETTIFLPTGDGMCIAILEPNPFDVHLKVALSILGRTAKHNEQTEDKMRQFHVRVGINENRDNVVIDINDKRNVAGTGINMSQRIMSLADGDQILMGQAVHEILSGREQYMQTLKKFDGGDKHGNSFPVYQYAAPNHHGLSTGVPNAFKPREVQEKKLSKLAAYYIAHALSNKDFLIAHKEDPAFDDAATILLYFKALDSVEESEISQYETFTAITHAGSGGTIEEQYAYYYKQDFWVCAKLESLITETVLSSYSSCFVSSAAYGRLYAFVSKRGIQKLKEEWPDIWKQFSLEDETK